MPEPAGSAAWPLLNGMKEKGLREYMTILMAMFTTIMLFGKPLWTLLDEPPPAAVAALREKPDHQHGQT